MKESVYSICAKGAAAIPFQYDEQRPQSPMIRDGARGSGQWRKVSWDEATRYWQNKPGTDYALL